ncbi:MAG: PAS domain S-box protein, partial [Coprothermobacterota bacterium]|nr:PAS domain S-box protein [Coprothermobacterota bacterium]
MPHPQKLTAGWVESWEKLLAGNLPFTIFLKGRDLTYLACNENYAANHGITPSEILGRSDYDLYPKELAEKYRAEDLRILETGRSETIEGRYVKDGQEHHGQTIKSLFRDPSGEVIGILGTFWDITELKQTEEKLRESASRYHELFEVGSDAIVLIDNATGNILEANSAVAALYGYDRAELLTKRNTDLSAEPEETQRVTHGTPIISDQVVTIPLRFHRKKDGTVFPTEITGRFFIREGRPVHIVAIRDITERKQAEAALRESKDFIENLIASMQDGISVLDSDGVQIDVNPAFCQMTGFSREELIGVGLPHPYWPPEAYEEIDKGFQKTLSGEFGDVDLVFMRKNGERFPV